MTQPSTFNPQTPSLPGYKILSPAGRGGMGAVYKAEQASPRRTVALKVLSRVSPDRLAEFRREAQTIAALEHPHIVPLYAFGEHDGAPFLTLRFLEGGSAADRLRSGPLDLATAARWVGTIADALHFAHERGIVHRDLKPSNILLDSSGNAYLADFGIAAAESETGGPPTGSAAYMPPEMGRGEPVDARGDLYSLAVTLFELLTGQKPYTAETSFGMMVRHLNDPIPSARALNPAIPPAVDELIQWTMAKLPDDRPQTALDFARRLKQALAHPAASVRPAAPSVVATPTLGPTAPPARPGPSPLWIGLGVLLLLACVAGIGVVIGSGALAVALLPSATPPPTATRLPATAVPNTPSPQPTSTLDPDGGIVVEGNTTRITVLTNGIEWMRPLSLSDATDVVVRAIAAQQSGPPRNEIALLCRFQDNNNHVAFAISGDGTYSIWRKSNGETTRLVDWTASQSIAWGEGAENHLEAVCDGASLRFAVNGQSVGEAADPAPIAGDVAVLAGLREAGELIVEFYAIELSAP